MTMSLTRNSAINQPVFQKRIHEIDFLRGFFICVVVMDHLFYCFANYSGQWYQLTGNSFFLGMNNAFVYYWNSWERDIVRYFVLFWFSFLSGISIAFSRNTWRRSILMILCWLGLANILLIGTQIPFFAQMGTIRIDFNIIGVVAICALFYSIATLFPNNKILYIYVLVGFLMWWYIIPNIPYKYQATHYNPFLWDPGISGVPQADWLPLFPYFMFYFLGAIANQYLYSNKQSMFRRYAFEKPICFLGRHSIWVYFIGSGFVIGASELLTMILQARKR